MALRAAFSATSSSSGAACVAVPALVAASDSLPAAWAASSSQRQYGQAAAEPSKCRTFGDIPPGHAASDLSAKVCNIGLNRRRDLTMRQDLCLYGKDGAKVTLADVLKGKKVIMVGFPGGNVCTQKHIPAYIAMADKLKSHGVDKVVAVTVDTPENVKAMAEEHNLHSPSGGGCKVDLMADKNGGLIRLLGVEMGMPDATDMPRCQRFAAIVEDGLLLKLCVEDSPKDLEVSDCTSMLKLWCEVYPKDTKPKA